jgi:hypothetical protein
MCFNFFDDPFLRPATLVKWIVTQGQRKWCFKKKFVTEIFGKKSTCLWELGTGQTLSVSIGSIRAATSNYKCTVIYVYLDSNIKYNFTGSSPRQKFSMSTF